MTLPKTKMPKIHTTPSSMLKDLSEENSMTQLFSQIWNIGHSKLKKAKMESLSSLSNTKAKTKNSILKKFHPWFWLRWKRLLKPTLDKRLKMLLSQYQPISMILKDKPQKMQALLQDWMWWESSTNQQQLLSLMVLTRKIKDKEMFWFLT